MKEVVFINKNKDRWSAFEKFLNGSKGIHPDELAEHYIQLTDDLAYVQTFYPKSNLVNYLNTLASRAHQTIYGNKKEQKSRFVDFFRYEVPLAIRQSHRQLFYSLIIFVVAITLGFMSSLLDDSFANLILGDRYVNMTLDNIENEDPMAVYKGHSQGAMFLMIGSNNIRVAIYAYLLGIFASLVTGYILFTNGVMVGAFQHFFIKKGLFWISFSTIFIHGALELSAIVIAGGAGLVVGNSWMFPGTYSRRVALMAGVKRSIKIMIALIPVFVVAALLESYVTRHYMELGNVGRIIIIVLSFAFIIWYFILYPIKIEKNGINKEVTAS